MTKSVLSLFFLLISLSVFSQQLPKEKNFSISLNLTDINIMSNDEIYDNYGVELQGGYFYKINDRLFFKTGIGINYFTLEKIENYIIFPCNLEAMFNGNDIHPSFLSTRVNWWYLNIPIELQYDLLNKKQRIYVKGSLNNWVNLADETTSFFHECDAEPRESVGTIGSIYGANSIYGVVNFGVGVEINLSQTMNLLLEPIIGYAFSNIIDIPSGIEEESSRSLNFGIQTGIRF